jgi:hypothetical protein
MQRQTCLLAVCLALLVQRWAVAKELTIRQHISVPNATAGLDQVIYWSDTKRCSDDIHRRSIADFEAQTFTAIDKDRKTYRVYTFDELRTRKEQRQKHFKGMPPQAKKLMEGLDAPINLRPTGNTQTIAGYQAKEYLIQGGPYSGSLWMAESIDIGSQLEEWKTLAGAMAGAPGPGAQLAEATSKLKGLPLRVSISAATGAKTFTLNTDVTEVAEQGPPPEVLKVPEGYTKAVAKSAR